MTRTKTDAMPFVHGLIRTKGGRGLGWKAPAELGEATPQYVGFVIPVDDERTPFSAYAFETTKIRKNGDRTRRHTMRRVGDDLFCLTINGHDVLFVPRSASVKDRYLPYIGKFKHPDLKLPLMEIMLEDFSYIDRLFAEDALVLVGCDAFRHYLTARGTRIRSRAGSHAAALAK